MQIFRSHNTINAPPIKVVINPSRTPDGPPFITAERSIPAPSVSPTKGIKIGPAGARKSENDLSRFPRIIPTMIGVIAARIERIGIFAKRPGYAGWAVATTAGNAVAVPAVVGLADKSLEAYVPQATAQVAASVVITAIIVPIVTNWWAHKYGCPKFPLEDKKAATK